MTFDSWLQAFAQTDKARRMWQTAQEAQRPSRQFFPPPASARPVAVQATVQRVPNSIFAMGAMAARATEDAP